MVACLETAAAARLRPAGRRAAAGAPPISCGKTPTGIRATRRAAHQEQVEAALKSALGSEAFAATVAEGAALPLEQAVKQALAM